MADSVKLNHQELRKLLQSPAVMAELKRRGDKIAAAAGPGFEVEEYVGRQRARVTVRTATWRARGREARDHILIRALDAGRG